MNITKRAVEQLAFAKTGSAADYRWDDSLKGFGVRVYPSARKTFLITYRNAQGTKRFLSLGDFGRLTVEQARRLAQSKLAEVCQGADPQAARAKARGDLSFVELAARYLEHVRSYKRSWKNDEQRLRDHLLRPWASGASPRSGSPTSRLLAQVKEAQPSHGEPLWRPAQTHARVRRALGARGEVACQGPEPVPGAAATRHRAEPG